ncbi:ATR-interacting protein [Dunckerocampus dactyliophorus]|uniref:ATR-interacting protein n=1 Tax=Dunckerocampus dactyliophorus TaxID=161453 RepID=UPI002404D826|nr:ATR-interacting protein [Dunckerocampus dactyliophorus]
MTCPPSKRLRGLNQDIPKADAFDDDDFTQDDLDEIDTIASQAINSTAASCFGSKAGEHGHGSGFRSSTWPSALLSRENMAGFGGKRGNLGDPLGNRQQQFGPEGGDSYSLLEAQHAELKRKLKEVEEEIVLKNGEIRVLRDSLRGVQQEKEAQRQNLVLLETQKQREQSDREKELNKKVQSLRSELQFKESEIMEMKSKLLSADRNKMASPIPRNSPKVLNGLGQLYHESGSSASSPTGNGFITKEMFAAQVPSRNTPVKTPVKSSGKTHRQSELRADRPASCGRSVDNQEVACPDPFQAIRPAYQQHRGGVLLGLLLQHPLSPSSLCLSHMLSMSLTDVSSSAPWDFSGLPAGSLRHNTTAAGISGTRSGAPRATLSPVQSLAITGLNMLSQSRAGTSASTTEYSCPGAVLLLPLLDLHLSGLSQALDAPGVTSGSLEGLRESRAPAAGPGSPDEAGYSLEDTGLVVLRLLSLLLAHSDEVVQAVLSTPCESDIENKADSSAASDGLHSHSTLLQSVLRLCRAGIGGSSSSTQWQELVISALKTVRVLTERTPHTHADRLQCVLQVMCASVSADAKPRALTECVLVLVALCDHTSLTRQLCSQHEPCVILKLLQYVRNRPAKQTWHAELILLELQVVRLLKRLTQTAEGWIHRQSSNCCQCYTELVQTVVIILHRQWMDLQDFPELMDRLPDLRPCLDVRSPAWSLLRECMQLLHWLLHHHSSFSASCRPLLHMYDQVIPALRDTLRKIPELSESEELALEEICRPEGDDTDDMDADFGS